VDYVEAELKYPHTDIFSVHSLRFSVARRGK